MLWLARPTRPRTPRAAAGATVDSIRSRRNHPRQGGQVRWRQAAPARFFCGCCPGRLGASRCERMRCGAHANTPVIVIAIAIPACCPWHHTTVASRLSHPYPPVPRSPARSVGAGRLAGVPISGQRVDQMPRQVANVHRSYLVRAAPDHASHRGRGLVGSHPGQTPDTGHTTPATRALLQSQPRFVCAAWWLAQPGEVPPAGSH